MNNMNYDPEIYTLSDENGEEHSFELLDTMELDGNIYYAMVPVYDELKDSIEGDAELVILKAEDPEDADSMLITIDDDDEYDRVGGIFLERIGDYYDSDDGDDDFDGDDYEGEES